ncbi:hypothetical protein EVAR_38039_1 [Eumeta japonica]|uniref:Uncharacterized protein n=1 Tax=Eumeta variegata TaxID=151549 RepID=A0A4C1WAV8_EUMVA|nr:hypothetical protein EVAR_38039_1 [Eumeta japonica]
MRATDAPWYIQNSVLHRDLELPTISKFMKNASERFFDIANSHPNPLLVSAVSYEPPPQQHFCRGPRNVLIDLPDDFTAEVEKFIEPCARVHGRPIMGFSPPYPSLSHGEKKKRHSVSLSAVVDKRRAPNSGVGSAVKSVFDYRLQKPA